MNVTASLQEILERYDRKEREELLDSLYDTGRTAARAAVTTAEGLHETAQPWADFEAADQLLVDLIDGEADYPGPDEVRAILTRAHLLLHEAIGAVQEATGHLDSIGTNTIADLDHYYESLGGIIE